MKIRATGNYFDLQLNKKIVKGEEYEVTQERGEQIINAKLAEEVKEAKPKRQTKKKKE